MGRRGKFHEETLGGFGTIGIRSFATLRLYHYIVITCRLLHRGIVAHSFCLFKSEQRRCRFALAIISLTKIQISRLSCFIFARYSLCKMLYCAVIVTYAIFTHTHRIHCRRHAVIGHCLIAAQVFIRLLVSAKVKLRFTGNTIGFCHILGFGITVKKRLRQSQCLGIVFAGKINLTAIIIGHIAWSHSVVNLRQ